jgi:predicted RNA-binding protein YlxR (DUF448 family)
VGCRERAAASDLLRVVVVDGVLAVDGRRRLPGRGAHVHPDLRCVDLAERRKALPRALRHAGPFDLTVLRQQLRGQDSTADDGGRTRGGESRMQSS